LLALNNAGVVTAKPARGLDRRHRKTALDDSTPSVLSSYIAVIQSFGDAATEDVFHGTNSKAARAIPKSMWPVVRRKLDLVNGATSVGALRVPPGNRLEPLRGDRAGSFSIRVNDQFRITFRFEGEHAHDVLCEDYH
jgi:proteic killer suppression protein